MHSPEGAMTTSTTLDLGRAAYAEQRWIDAVDHLTDADKAGGLPAQDLERLSTAAILIGHASDGIDTLTRAHEGFLTIGDVASAARCAGWIGINLMDLGEQARSAGWIARAQRLVQENPEFGSLEGFLLALQGLGELFAGDAESSARTFDQVAEFGERFRDPDLMALGRLGQGRTRISLGRTDEGLALLDEVMVAVTAGELSPIPSGIIYCAVIGACQLAFDPRRAQEWTAALDHWCGAQPDMVPFSGACQMHRAELYVLHGAWADALVAAQVAQERFRRGDTHAAYGAFYHQGEVQRMRGEFDTAEESYHQANKSGFEPQPGLALLRLAQGKTQLAQTLIRRAVDGVDVGTRRQLLPALVEIELAARGGADELIATSQASSMPMVQAIADQAAGAVLLVEGDASNALRKLRRAWNLWRELDAPYEAARCRVLAARACRALGDEDSASMELEAAREVFLDLGAGPALVEVDALSHTETAGAVGPLTAREIEVVRLVSAGKSNRVIAVELYLSEKTVARHISNVFSKLGLTSRAAATAYAYEHGLV